MANFASTCENTNFIYISIIEICNLCISVNNGNCKLWLINTYFYTIDITLCINVWLYVYILSTYFYYGCHGVVGYGAEFRT